MKKMNEIIKEKGWCLKDCHAHGPTLRHALLRRKKKLMASNGEVAKQYRYDKKCMVTIKTCQ